MCNGLCAFDGVHLHSVEVGYAMHFSDISLLSPSKCWDPTPDTQSCNLSFILLVFISPFTFYITIDAAGRLAFVVMHFSWVGAYCLSSYVDYITALLLNNSKEAPARLKYYRQVQLLNRYYNLIQQDELLKSVIIMDIMGVTVSFYTIISLRSQINIPELLLFSR